MRNWTPSAVSYFVIGQESSCVRVRSRKSSVEPFLDAGPQPRVFFASECVGPAVEGNTHYKLVFGSTHFYPQVQAIVLKSKVWNEEFLKGNYRKFSKNLKKEKLNWELLRLYNSGVSSKVKGRARVVIFI